MNLKKLAMFLSCVALVSCGGGGSSSGGVDYNGTYKGVGSVTFSARGQSQSNNIGVIVIVSGQDVAVSDIGKSFGRGKRTGSTYNVPWNFTSQDPTLGTCKWALRYKGELLSAQTRGVISGSFKCTRSVTVSVSGSYEINKTAESSKARLDSSDSLSWASLVN